jgi:putative DNA primase/helicase
VAYLRAKNLNGRFEMAGFLGRTVLVGKDVSGETLSENGARTLKSLTGGDLMEGEIKFQQHRPAFVGEFHVVITSNSELRIALEGDESAWTRRLVVVKFDRQEPEKKIANLADELVEEEGSGILNWLIEGAMRYEQQLANGGILLTPEQKERVSRLLHNSDTVKVFVEKCIDFEPGKDVSSVELADSYMAHCRQNKWAPLSENKFLEQVSHTLLSQHSIRQRHDIMRKNGPVRGYKGIKLG